jgi:DNA invertase Pin-like site-specific DNA recombinase
MNQFRFAPIIRVSTEQQERQGESLNVQTNQIKKYVESLGGSIPEECWQYTGQEHATEGYERKMIDQLLDDSSKGIFDAVIVADASRWSRDNRKSKDGLDVLKRNNIRFFVGTTEYDLYNPTQSLFLGISAEIGEFQAKEQSRKSLLSKIERAENGIPAVGTLPYGRTYDKVNGWGIIPEAQQLMQNAAKRYLAGEGMRTIAASLGMPVPTLWKYMNKMSGDEWVLHFSNKKLNIDKTVTLKIPPLLDKETCEAIRKQAIASRTFHHGGIKNKYLLSRMLFCKSCGYALIGTAKHGTKRYYRHAPDYEKHCFKKVIPADELEIAVMLQLAKTYGDPEAMKLAIKKMTPDTKRRSELEKELKELDYAIATVTDQRNALIDSIAKRILTDDEAKTKMDKLREQQAALNLRHNSLEAELKVIPQPEQIEKSAKLATEVYLDALKNKPEAILDQPFEWQRMLLEHAFGGTDKNGKRLGVYIEVSNEPGKRFNFEIRGSLETSLLSLPLSDQNLYELFHLDSDFTSDNDIQELRKRCTNYTTYLLRKPRRQRFLSAWDM